MVVEKRSGDQAKNGSEWWTLRYKHRLRVLSARDGPLGSVYLTLPYLPYPSTRRERERKLGRQRSLRSIDVHLDSNLYILYLPTYGKIFMAIVGDLREREDIYTSVVTSTDSSIVSNHQSPPSANLDRGTARAGHGGRGSHHFFQSVCRICRMYCSPSFVYLITLGCLG